MTQYCLGFYFTSDLQSVALIRKEKPAWQKGLWNGIGGKIEAGEIAFDAMVREFREETGARVDNWRQCATLQGLEFQVTVYVASGHQVTLEKTTEELPAWITVRNIFVTATVPNVPWLILYCRDFLQNPAGPASLLVGYQ